MTKRDAPESGFDTTNPAKRQISNNGSASGDVAPMDSIQPGSSTHARVPSAPSTTPAAVTGYTNGSAPRSFPPSTVPCTHGNHGSPLTEPQLSDAALPEAEDAFVLDNSRRNELANEASNLQLMPASAIDEVSNPSLIPDEEAQPLDEDSQGDEDDAEQSTREAPPGKRNKKNWDKNQFRRKKKRAFYDPRLWEEGAQDPAAAYIARKSDALICGTTNVTVDTEPLLVMGTLWKDILLDELPDLLRSVEYTPLPPRQERDDFLKACMRLGRLIEPTRLSRLLGGRHRSPEYCAFLLHGFLGVLNNPKVRRVLRGETEERPEERHRDVVVYADQLYPSDDEILDCGGTEAASGSAQQGTMTQDANLEVAEIEESDQEEGGGHRDPPHADRSAVHESRHKDREEQGFFMKSSYVMRSYMRNLTGQHIKDIDDFEAYCKKLQMTFLSDPRRQPLSRLKWLTESMPAPELGTGRTVTGPLELWKHAMKTYSVKNLSRCALVKVDPLLDWLGYVANEAEPATSEEEYFRVKRPVVSIAPIPLLHLADKAIDFALRVLSMATQTAEMNPLAEETDEAQFIIDDDDIESAAQCLTGDPNERPHLYLNMDLSVLGYPHNYNCEWPGLVQRPLTSFETLALCDRAPKASVSIPNSATDEMRAVLMSFRRCVRSKLYANGKLFKHKDPLHYMSREEQKESKLKRKERNDANGIKWFAKGGQEEEEDGDDDDAKKRESMTASDAVRVPLSDQTAGDQRIPASGRSSMNAKNNLPEFFDQVNFAELIAFRIGAEELSKRKKDAFNQDLKSTDGETSDDAASVLKMTASEGKCTTSTVCLHRLGWICTHALGIAVDEVVDDNHPMGYATTANYTNFAQLRTGKPVVLTTRALFCLAQMTDVVVRGEAEVLMACAAHDDGRPWIDRADVALVTSVRKEEFCYNEL